MIERLRRSFAPGSIRGDAARIYALQFATIGFSLVVSVLVARSLGPAHKGVVDLFNLLNAFINDLGALGFGTGLLYALMAWRRPANALHGAAVAFALAVGLATVVAALFARGWIDRALPGLPTWAVLLACVLAPVTYYRLIWSNLMTGLSKSVPVYWLGLWVSVGTFAVLGALWLLHRLTATSVIIVTAAVAVVGCIASYAILHRDVGIARPAGSLLRESAGYGFVTYMSAAANTLHFKIDQVMLNAMLGTSAVGIYAVGVRWAESLFLLDSAIFAAAVHRIGASANTESYALTKRLFFIQVAISGGAGLIVALCSPLLVVGAYGEAYRGAIVPMILLMPGVVAWSAGKLLSQYLVLRRGKNYLALAFSVVGLVVNVVINLVLIPRAGLVGAATASSISYGLVIALTLAAFRYLGRRPPADDAAPIGTAEVLEAPAAATVT